MRSYKRRDEFKIFHDKLGGQLIDDVGNRYQEFLGDVPSPSGARGLAGGMVGIEPVPGQLLGPRG
jgi:hypothetical protein